MKSAVLRLARVRGEALWRRAQNDSLDLLSAAIRHLAEPGESRARTERALARHRRPAEPRMAPLVHAFGEQRPHAVFVQIGGNDDPERLPLRDAAGRWRWQGVVVEPVPSALEALRRQYGHLPDAAFECAAIAPQDGERPFYHLPGDPGSQQAGSLRRELLLFRRRFSGEIEDQVLQINAQCLTFASLCARHRITAADVLTIDTDGSDETILEQIDLDRFRPALIVYESGPLAPQASMSCIERLRSFGYDTLENGTSTWALRTGDLAREEAAVIGPLWRWTANKHAPGRPLRPTALLRARARAGSRANGSCPEEQFPLTESERRYLANGYDDGVPLPANAREYLSSENPRLGELRAAYGALETPALQHHVWRPAQVSERVDLRYFRGDNLYLWHYPEHPRAMALGLFVYMRYLMQRGGEVLLERLCEDGSFGCWTAEISGYGKVSRDLLDSINELLFLDRQLGVLGADGLRVLDIGAGYGRLAHRMCVAISSLNDYCCVDAIPESTFLSEYYLAFRGCSPPARVVPLPDVERVLEPGSFDLAVNVHSFSECTLSAIEWWMRQLARLKVGHLFVVPNEAEGIVSRETDGGYQDAMPAIEAAGYRQVAFERVLDDPAVRDMVRINDNFYLFARST